MALQDDGDLIKGLGFVYMRRISKRLLTTFLVPLLL